MFHLFLSFYFYEYKNNCVAFVVICTSDNYHSHDMNQEQGSDIK